MKTLFIFMALLVGSVTAQTPIGFKKWRNNENTFTQRIGGAVQNFIRTDRTWAQIANDFVTEGDSVLKIDDAVIKTRVNKNGASSSTVRWDSQNYIATQKLLGVGWLNIVSKTRQWIDATMDFSNVSVDSNIVSWSGVSPGVDYRIRKQNGVLEHGIFFKSAFIAAAVAIYDLRADSLEIALANIMVYTLTSNIANADSGLGILTSRQLKSFGEYSFSLGDQTLRYPGWDTLPPIPIKQFWRKRNDSLFCIEFVMMSDVKAVHLADLTATIWHNDTKKIEGATNIQDTYISGFSQDADLGAITTLQPADNGTNSIHALVRVTNVATEIGAGATITFAACSLFFVTNSVDGDISAYRVFKPWVQGTGTGGGCTDGCSWLDWDCAGNNDWTTVGCLCIGDDGSDNSQDGGTCNSSGRDRKATAESTTNVTTTGRFGWDISNALAQGWYDGSFNEEGIVLDPDGQSNNVFSSVEHVTAGNRPFFTFVFTTGVSRVLIRK